MQCSQEFHWNCLYCIYVGALWLPGFTPVLRYKEYHDCLIKFLRSLRRKRMRDRDGSTVCAVSFVLAVTLLLRRLSLIDSVCRVSVRRGTHRQQYRWFATLNDGPVVPSCYDSLSVWFGAAELYNAVWATSEVTAHISQEASVRYAFFCKEMFSGKWLWTYWPVKWFASLGKRHWCTVTKCRFP